MRRQATHGGVGSTLIACGTFIPSVTLAQRGAVGHHAVAVGWARHAVANRLVASGPSVSSLTGTAEAVCVS